MSSDNVRLGFDRFVAKSWADQALSLFATPGDFEHKYSHLKEWLSFKISGKETARKTANQLKRLWLTPKDGNQILRDSILIDGLFDASQDSRIYHYGMAINAFPIFLDVCALIGKLSRLQGECASREVKDRIIEKYGSPLSTPRITDRIFQTLRDWRIIEFDKNSVTPIPLELKNGDQTRWFLFALVFTSATKSMPLTDLTSSPLKLGITTNDIRRELGIGSLLQIHRDATNHEIVMVRDN